MAIRHRRGLFILLLACSGCFNGPQSVRRLADERLIPSRWTGAVTASGQDQATRRLDYDAVYMAEPVNLHSVTTDVQYYLERYRFWRGGQVLRTSDYVITPPTTSPTAAEADDFRRSTVGKYAVIGDEVTMEFLQGGSEGGPFYYRARGRILSDGTLEVITPTLGEGYGKPDIVTNYRHVPVADMRRFADW